MRISSTGTVRPPVGRIGRDALSAETSGADAQFFADHMMGWFPASIWTERYTPAARARESAHDYVDPVCALMSAAAATSTIRLGLGVTDVIRNHPATLARLALTLQMFTDGRFVLGLGSGEAENLVPYGLGMHKAVSRLEEGLAVIRALWSAVEPVSFDGDHFQLRNALLDISMAGVPEPPIWLAARGPRMREIAAQNADGWLPMYLTPMEYGDMLREIRQRRATLGIERPMEAAFYGFVVLAESREQCLEYFESPIYRCLGLLAPPEVYHARRLEHPLGEGRYGIVDFVPSGLSERDALDLLERVPPEVVGDAVMFGSPDDVLAELSRFAEAGCEHVVLGNVSFLTDLDNARPSYQAFDELIRSAATLETSSPTATKGEPRVP
jgi:phthiodiolone/phenolphthiodiolone dimycocerosates ketoreductase